MKAGQEEVSALKQAQTLQNYTSGAGQSPSREKAEKPDGQRVKKSAELREQIKSLEAQIRERDAQVRDLKEDLNRKRDIIQTTKHSRDEKEFELQGLLQENTQLKEENERLKKTAKEVTRLNQSVRDLKDKVDLLKVNEKQLQEEKNALSEKLKGYKGDVQRKESFIKDLKERLDGETSKVYTQTGANQSQILSQVPPEFEEKYKE